MIGTQAVIFRAIQATADGASVDDLARATGASPDTVRKLVQRVRARVDANARSIVTVRRPGRPTVYRLERERRS